MKKAHLQGLWIWAGLMFVVGFLAQFVLDLYRILNQ